MDQIGKFGSAWKGMKRCEREGKKRKKVEDHTRKNFPQRTKKKRAAEVSGTRRRFPSGGNDPHGRRQGKKKNGKKKMLNSFKKPK